MKIVFMTDGSKSHKDYLSKNELKAIRASEGIAASKALGLDDQNIIFLNFEEMKLYEHLDAATLKVKEIILQYKPDEIFIPYYYENNSDHFATNRAVVAAVKNLRRNIVIYEFPIWFWRFWPYFCGSINNFREYLGASKKSMISGFRLLRDFRCSVYIGDVLGAKRAALDKHKSQMTQLIPDSNYPTLVSFENGEFLSRFFQEYEIFHKYAL